MKFDTTNNSHRIFSQEVYEKVSAIRGKNPECAKKIEVALNAKGCFFLQNINFIMRMLDNREYDIALEKSLLLPDVCGKAEGWLKKSGKPLNSMDRYKEWLNQYIIPCNTVPSSSISLFTADELCQIRNALIHEQRLDAFSFSWVLDNPVLGGTIMASTSMETAAVPIVKKEINIPNLCFQIYQTALGCYLISPCKFDFIRRSILFPDSPDRKLEYVFPSIKYYYSNPENKTDFH